MICARIGHVVRDRAAYKYGSDLIRKLAAAMGLLTKHKTPGQ